MAPITGSSRSRPTADFAELHRVAEALACVEGWVTAGPVAGEPGGGVSLPVTGDGLRSRARLRVRVRQPWNAPVAARGAAGGDPRPPGGRAPAGTELLARRQAASEHVIGVVRELGRRQLRGREVESVLLADACGTLAELVAGRDGVSGGEAATVLVGVVRGVTALHEAGWAAPTLAMDGVVFTADGCPALDVLDDVVEFRAEAAVADAEAFHAFARALCLRVIDGTGMRLLAAVEGALGTGRLPAVEESVTATARPVAVRWGAEGDASPATHARPVGQQDSVRADNRHRDRDRVTVNAADRAADRRVMARRSSTPVAADQAGAGRTRRTFGMRFAAAVELLDGRPIRSLRTRLIGVVRRRPALIVAAALPVLFGLVLVAVLPGATEPVKTAGQNEAGDSGATASTKNSGAMPVEQPDAPAQRERVRASDDVTVAAPTSSTEGVATRPDGQATSPEAGAAADGADVSAHPDDPVDAARSLLTARHACFATGPAPSTCLDDVLDVGGGLAADEVAALARRGARDERDYAGADFALVERWGDAALVAVVPDRARTPKSEPASLLLVRGEAGWRLRAVFP